MISEKELNKIPEICNQKPCYFELIKDSSRGIEYIKKLVEMRCSKICPKYSAKESRLKREISK